MAFLVTQKRPTVSSRLCYLISYLPWCSRSIGRPLGQFAYNGRVAKDDSHKRQDKLHDIGKSAVNSQNILILPMFETLVRRIDCGSLILITRPILHMKGVGGREKQRQEVDDS